MSDESDATIGLSAQPSPEQDPGFLPDDFEPPTLVETGNFKLIPLGPALVEIDFAAYMSSIEHLQRTFSRSASWPHENISDEDAMQDMLNEQRRFRMRESFAYAVLTPEGDRELGCVYVYPSPRREYDAMVRLWVTKAEYDAGFDETLYAWVQDWLQSWPFENIAYPGRSISWEEWEKVPSV
ncbi:MAG: twin-arginine translocation pathway signal protein [Pseudomonadota bacterium]